MRNMYFNFRISLLEPIDAKRNCKNLNKIHIEITVKHDVKTEIYFTLIEIHFRNSKLGIIVKKKDFHCIDTHI